MFAVRGVYDGHVARPIEPVSAPPNASVLLVFTEEYAPKTTREDSMRFFGCLKGRPAFQGDSVGLQRTWREEWDA